MWRISKWLRRYIKLQAGILACTAGKLPADVAMVFAIFVYNANTINYGKDNTPGKKYKALSRNAGH